jgi:hypothetical protein
MVGKLSNWKVKGGSKSYATTKSEANFWSRVCSYGAIAGIGANLQASGNEILATTSKSKEERRCLSCI